MPDLTSIKVSRTVRDRLARAAEARGVTVRALLDELSRGAEDAAEMETVAHQMARLRETDPVAWDEYMREGRSWEESTAEPFDA